MPDTRTYTDLMPDGRPAGLTVTIVAPNRVGIAYRAHCQAHDYCRNPSSAYAVTWCADSWEDLHLRVFPAFYRHCQDMEQRV